MLLEQLAGGRAGLDRGPGRLGQLAQGGERDGAELLETSAGLAPDAPVGRSEERGELDRGRGERRRRARRGTCGEREDLVVARDHHDVPGDRQPAGTSRHAGARDLAAVGEVDPDQEGVVVLVAVGREVERALRGGSGPDGAVLELEPAKRDPARASGGEQQRARVGGRAGHGLEEDRAERGDPHDESVGAGERLVNQGPVARVARDETVEVEPHERLAPQLEAALGQSPRDHGPRVRDPPDGSVEVERGDASVGGDERPLAARDERGVEPARGPQRRAPDERALAVEGEDDPLRPDRGQRDDRSPDARDGVHVVVGSGAHVAAGVESGADPPRGAVEHVDQTSSAHERELLSGGDGLGRVVAGERPEALERRAPEQAAGLELAGAHALLVVDEDRIALGAREQARERRGHRGRCRAGRHSPEQAQRRALRERDDPELRRRRRPRARGPVGPGPRAQEQASALDLGPERLVVELAHVVAPSSLPDDDRRHEVAHLEGEVARDDRCARGPRRRGVARDQPAELDRVARGRRRLEARGRLVVAEAAIGVAPRARQRHQPGAGEAEHARPAGELRRLPRRRDELGPVSGLGQDLVEELRRGVVPLVGHEVSIVLLLRKVGDGAVAQEPRLDLAGEVAVPGPAGLDEDDRAVGEPDLLDVAFRARRRSLPALPPSVRRAGSGRRRREPDQPERPEPERQPTRARHSVRRASPEGGLWPRA